MRDCKRVDDDAVKERKDEKSGAWLHAIGRRDPRANMQTLKRRVLAPFVSDPFRVLTIRKHCSSPNSTTT